MGARRWRSRSPAKADQRDEWPLEFKAAKSDPWDELKHVEDAIERAHRKEAEKTFDPKVHFDAGTYTEQGEGVHFQSWAVEAPSYALDRLADAVGIPIDFGWVTILRASSRDSVALQFEPTAAWYFRLLRTLRRTSDESVERFFSRVAVALLSETIVVELIEKLTGAVEFWRHRSTSLNPSTGKKQFEMDPIDKICLYLEVLSRLVIRTDPTRARKLYDLALDIIRDPDVRHWNLFEPLDHLFQRCGEAMPKETRAELLLPAVEFPLQSEIGISMLEHLWPTPVSHIADCPLKKPIDAARWGLRVQQLISATRLVNSSSRADAAIRLFHLDNAGLLEPTEREAFGDALWAQQDPKTHLPIGTNLVAHVFLDLPSPDVNAARRYFTEALFKAPAATELLTQTNLMAIIGAATPNKRRTEAIRPPREDAVRLFDIMLTAQPSQTNELGADMISTTRDASNRPGFNKSHHAYAWRQRFYR